MRFFAEFLEKQLKRRSCAENDRRKPEKSANLNAKEAARKEARGAKQNGKADKTAKHKQEIPHSEFFQISQKKQQQKRTKKKVALGLQPRKTQELRNFRHRKNLQTSTKHCHNRRKSN